mmetsp:Transcript_78783/g.231142  ORF Transcript_78783/g.231142 Transcript_78783/m.231142 type:complete len:283 (+) Transcript_78783:2185-3033(+)
MPLMWPCHPPQLLAMPRRLGCQQLEQRLLQLRASNPPRMYRCQSRLPLVRGPPWQVFWRRPQAACLMRTSPRPWICVLHLSLLPSLQEVLLPRRHLLLSQTGALTQHRRPLHSSPAAREELPRKRRRSSVLAGALPRRRLLSRPARQALHRRREAGQALHRRQEARHVGRQGRQLPSAVQRGLCLRHQQQWGGLHQVGSQRVLPRRRLPSSLRQVLPPQLQHRPPVHLCRCSSPPSSRPHGPRPQARCRGLHRRSRRVHPQRMAMPPTRAPKRPAQRTSIMA